jgi:hypothetical protein
VWDKNTASPTYWEGGYGKRPFYKKSEKVITTDQARTMAAGILTKILAGSSEIILTIVPNPLLVLGDLCRVIDTDSGIDASYIISAISGSAGSENIADPMTVKLRRGVVLAELGSVNG